MKRKFKVLHYNAVFFERSETFIHHYFSNFKNVQPFLYSHKYQDTDFFEFSKDMCFTGPFPFPKDSTWDWFKVKFRQKILGTHFTAEEIFCRENKFKVIHAHFGPQGFFAVNWFEKSRIPVVTNFYGFDVSELPRDPLWTRRFKDLFKKGALFLVEGAFMRSKLEQLGCPSNKIQIQRIAIPLEKLLFRKRYAKGAHDKTIFVFCGRFVEKKGLRYALEAFAKVKQKNPNFEFRIIGDGPLNEELRCLTHQLDLIDNVTFLGFLNYQQYLDELNKSDIFIHPSITSKTGDSEGGAPTVILEAQAMGLPIVTSDHADIPNIVSPDQSALISKERDVQGLAKNIAVILEDQHVWEKMGKAGRSFVEKFHDIQKEVLELEKKYFQIA